MGQCQIIAKHVPREIIYIDNKFLKIDDTMYINSEGALGSHPFDQGIANEITSEGVINVLVDDDTVNVNDDNQLYVSTASDTQKGVVKIDNSTIKFNGDGQIEFDMSNNIDRGLDASTGKIGHTNSVDASSVGAELKYVNISYDEFGHITEATEGDIPVMQKATSTSDGYKGLVPTPKKGDQTKFLTGNGTWESVVTSSMFNVISTEMSASVGPSNTYITCIPTPPEGKMVIAPCGWTLDTEDRFRENIEVAYAHENNISRIVVCVRSNAGVIPITATGY